MAVKEKRELSPNQRLRHERELRGWSQAKLADKIGTTCATVNRWERGNKTPSPYFRERLCDLFGKNAEELGLLPQGVEVIDIPSHERPSLRQSSMLPASIMLPPNPATPPPLTLIQGLVGRDELLYSLKRQLFNGEMQACTAIYGLPGVGKTALALTLAHDQELKDHFSDEILWVSLGPKPDVLGLLGRWGVHLGIVPAEISDPTSRDAWAKAIFSAIGQRRMLLIIDDSWDTASALAFKVAGPRCAYLLTTRFPEVALHFAPYSATVVHELTEEDGLRLLKQLAPEVVRNEPAAAQNLVRYVGGLPLALTIMGNYLRVQAYSGQLRRVQNAVSQLHDVEKRLSLSLPRGPIEFSNLPIDIPMSLQSVIEISYQQLTGEACRTLCLLSLFPAKPNTFSEEAVLTIWATSAAALDELTDAGLLEGSRPGRYTLHQTIADYAALRFAEMEPGEQAVAWEKLIVFFTSYAQKHSAEYESLEAEESNIRIALQKAYEQGMLVDLVRGANGFASFLIARGFYDLAETHLENAQKAALVLRDEQALVCTWLYLGQIAEERGDLSQSDQRYGQGLSIARRINHGEITCDLLTRRGEVRINQGEFVLARKDLQQGLTFARKIGHRRRICILLRILGELYDSYGNYAHSAELYQEGLALAREIGDWETVSGLLQSLGAKSEWCGDYVEAEKFYQEGLAIAHQIKHRQISCGLMMHIGEVAMRQIRFEQADHLYRESLQLARDIGARRKISAILQKQGILAYECGDCITAKEYLTESLNLAYATGDHRLIIETLNEWGELCLKQQLIEEASLSFAKAHDMAQERDIRRQVAIALFGLARIAALQGDVKEAERQGKKSSAIFEELNDEKRGKVAQWLHGSDL
jgi:tetratricopeptide (TPR) repeat protein/transcriptional regulator with XRE-family HTH domain